MYSPSLQRLLIEARTQELHCTRQTWSAQPVTTMGRTAIRKRRKLRRSIYLSRALDRFAGRPAPEAYAF